MTSTNERVVCKSDEEIEAFLKRKFLLTLTNNKALNITEYETDSMFKEQSHLRWTPIYPKLRKEIVNQIKSGQVQM